MSHYKTLNVIFVSAQILFIDLDLSIYDFKLEEVLYFGPANQSTELARGQFLFSAINLNRSVRTEGVEDAHAKDA